MPKEPNHKLLKAIGGKIRGIRKAQKVTQERLAELPGYNTTYISDIEGGKANATLSCFDSVASALGLTLSELVKEAEDEVRGN